MNNDQFRVIDLEQGKISYNIGDKFEICTNLTNGLDKGDILTIQNKKPSFGAEFYSGILSKTFFLDDYILLKKVS